MRTSTTVAITQDPASYDEQALRRSEYRLVLDMAVERRRRSGSRVLATIPVAFFVGYRAGVETTLDDVLEDVEEDER